MSALAVAPGAYRGRFAPSPTGELHFGSLVAALAGWLRAQQAGGEWLLRVEDIDPPREIAGSAAAIIHTLELLGLQTRTQPLLQSGRSAAHAAALATLRDHGHAFPCWCSRGDLEAARAVHHELHRDGYCFTPSDVTRPPAWRLRVPDGEIAFEDLLQGPQRQNVRTTVGDFVLLRADGLWSYQLACVVDDAFQRVTEVVRGYDLLESTPRQILLQRLLSLPTPAYLHLPLAVDAAGHKLSKSSDAPPVDTHDPCDTLARALAFLGQAVPTDTDPASMLRSAARDFDLAPLRQLASRSAPENLA